MGDLIGKLIDWARRLWWLIGLAPSLWAGWEAKTAGVPTHEVIFVTIFTLAGALNVLFVAHHFLIWWQRRQGRMAVVELLQERKDARHRVIKLAELATIWQENEGRTGLAAYWGTNAKFRQLKIAVGNNEIKGAVRGHGESDADVDSLIRYFQNME